jgi:hypothetical protein
LLSQHAEALAPANQKGKKSLGENLLVFVCLADDVL